MNSSGLYLFANPFMLSALLTIETLRSLHADTVAVGTSVAMEVGCEPEGAGMFMSTSWQTRRLKCDGTYSDWNDIGENGSGASLLYTPQTGGIYHVRSFVSLRNSPGMDLERRFVWSEDEPEATGICNKGELKAFGACDEMWQMALRNAALSQIGSTSFKKTSHLSSREPFTFVQPWRWKCSMFVAHMILDAQATESIGVPVQRVLNQRNYPPSANEWANGAPIRGWTHLGGQDFVQPGFVVGHPSPEGSGHCGITDFDGEAISARETRVDRSYPFWHDTTSGYNKYIGGE